MGLNGRFHIPKVVRSFSLADYAPEFEEIIFHVWVNPPRERLKALADLGQGVEKIAARLVAAQDPDGGPIKEELNRAVDQVYAWWSDMLSQGPEGERWTTQELRELASKTADTDPALWPFITRRASALIREHRESARKN